MGWLKLYSPGDGQVSDHEKDISDYVNWAFRIGLVQAFAGAGLIDARGRLAGWAELNGWLYTRAEADRVRKREKRAKKPPARKPRAPTVTPLRETFSDTRPLRKESGNA